MDGQSGKDEVEAFLAGDSGVHAVVRRAVGIVVRAFRFSGAGLDEDLIQETIARVFINLSVGAFRRESSLATYAQRIARYVCLEQIRKRRFAAEVDPVVLSRPDPSPVPEASLLRAEAHRRGLAILASMSPGCRELFRLIFVEELSYLQVAERLGISETAVKLRVRRCRLTIRSAREEAGSREIPPLPSGVWRHLDEEEE